MVNGRKSGSSASVLAQPVEKLEEETSAEIPSVADAGNEDDKEVEDTLEDADQVITESREVNNLRVPDHMKPKSKSRRSDSVITFAGVFGLNLQLKF